MLAGCDAVDLSNTDSQVRKMLASANELTYRAQRLLLGNDWLAPEYTESDIRQPQKPNGTDSPQDDDYKSLDVKGKIVVLAQGAPNFPSSIKAHYSAVEVKAKIAADHGAVGVIAIDDPVSESIYPFAKFAANMIFRLAGGRDVTWFRGELVDALILGAIVFVIAQVMEFGREIEQDRAEII